MATGRQRANGTWEFIVKRKSVLGKPFSRTFATKEEGEAYCRRLETLLDRGIVPPELADDTRLCRTVMDVVTQYELKRSIKESEQAVLKVVIK
jgi:hypothetical protein